MLKMLMELDVDKIQEDDIYDYNKIESYLEQKFMQHGIHKDETGFYVGGTFADFGSMILGLSKSEWFMKYVKVWKWYNSDGQINPNDFVVEDMAEFWRTKRKIAG